MPASQQKSSAHSSSAPRAVLWDMDGTLIDSEEYHWQSWQATMAHYGHPITRELFRASFGQRNDAILTNWLGSAATPELITKIGAEKEKRYRDLVRTRGISPMPGVDLWTHRLHEQGWLQAIASAAPRRNIEVILDALAMSKCFQGIAAAEDVKKGKPDPEVFLKAAASTGAPPERCIVVEDAAAGIEGARRAGMHSIGVNRNNLKLGADIVVASLEDLDAGAFDALIPG
jgi:HAD superfamily hydrolase (TIGR01509 family)